MVSIADFPNRVPGDTLGSAKSYGKTNARVSPSSRFASSFRVDLLRSMTVFVNDLETKVVRRSKRIMNAWAGNQWVLDTPVTERASAIKWLTECLELKPEQFVLVSSLPDCPPEKKAYSTAGVKRTPSAGQYWMVRNNGCVSSVYGNGEHIRSRYGTFWPKMMNQASATVGMADELDMNKVFWVTQKQADRWVADGRLNVDMRLDKVIQKKNQDLVDLDVLDKALAYRAVQDAIGHYNKAAFSVVIERFFADLQGMTASSAADAVKLAEAAHVSLDRDISDIKNKIKDLAVDFPLLFPINGSVDVYRTYVQAIQKIKETA